ncbi:glyoxalase [Alteromonas macleodii]|uniref:Glyoxalase n=1 Tax=Alteromonas macleodii TaxID=28108 RepID=A0A126Q0W6_ALTMA|nr:VOC family protein [Alteromonas macleodii]AMJ98892.1 glyoxalase [Alteromonas macleodii]|tara:strand:- start:1304 stop:1708 length:405 start_codon:yes stop_codon:yes gene_type:complete
MVKFGYTIIYVSDVDQAISFFERAFGMERKFVTEEGDYGEINTGETTLAFASHEHGSTNFVGGYINGSETEKPLGIEIALVTSDVNEIHSAAIENGAKELKSPEKKPWGQTISYVRCPSGVLLELCTPVSGPEL